MEGIAPLLSRAARGEQAAFRELYRLCRPLVVRLAGGFPLDPDEVEDVVQESFVRAFRNLHQLKTPAAFHGWLLSISRNRAATRVEQRTTARRVAAQLKQEAPHATPSLPPGLKLEREAALVRELIAELPEGPEKQTVQLFYVEGQLSAREIAEKLGLGKSAVTMRLERFRAKVKRTLLQRLVAADLE